MRRKGVRAKIRLGLPSLHGLVGGLSGLPICMVCRVMGSLGSLGLPSCHHMVCQIVPGLQGLSPAIVPGFAKDLQFATS